MALILLIPLAYANLKAAQESLQGAKPSHHYAGAAAWLEAHSEPGARVFQTDWDDFPRLFYFNTHNTHTLGLDPTYMQRFDPQLFDTWVDISQGRIAEPAGPIATQFGRQFVFTDLKHTRFIQKAEEDPGLQEIYRDDEALIFQVVAPETGLGQP